MRWLIFGISGQDGSYLAELILKKGDTVGGVMRRSSLPTTERIEHLFKYEGTGRFELFYGDICDDASIRRAIQKFNPDYIINLAAQSHVGISFDNPISTAEFNAIGPLRILEAIKDINPKIRFYQASSSEMFGSSPPPQDENTVMKPQSPYGCAKLYAYHITRLYRNAYGLFASNGILFNHETVADFMPLFVKEGDTFDIKPFSDVLTFIDKSNKTYQSKQIDDLEILGKDGWVKVNYASGYPHDLKNNKNPKFISARCGGYMATGEHVAFMEDEEKKTEEIVEGDKFEIVKFNLNNTRSETISNEEAELIGMLVADGYISRNRKRGKFTKNSEVIRARFIELWNSIVGTPLSEQNTPSGFKKGNFVRQVCFNNNDWINNLDLYTKDRYKRIPKCILNSHHEAKHSFMKGYNSCDGLKKDKCTYEFKAFKTNSATLAQGLWYLTEELLPDQRKTFYTTTSSKGSIIYCINLNSPRKIKSHLSKPFNEVTKIIDMSNYEGWFYDLETESGEFIAGIGNIHVHNSPRRGYNFVTRKITIGIAKIVNALMEGREEKLELGNLNATRDWGYSQDYMKAVIKIMEHYEPDDFVIATKETYSIKDFLNEAFGLMGADWKKYVNISDKFKRPAEVQALQGIADKAEKVLDWKPEVGFKELVEMMLRSDIMKISKITLEEAKEVFKKYGKH